MIEVPRQHLDIHGRKCPPPLAFVRLPRLCGLGRWRWSWALGRACIPVDAGKCSEGLCISGMDASTMPQDSLGALNQARPRRKRHLSEILIDSFDDVRPSGKVREFQGFREQDLWLRRGHWLQELLRCLCNCVVRATADTRAPAPAERPTNTPPRPDLYPGLRVSYAAGARAPPAPFCRGGARRHAAAGRAERNGAGAGAKAHGRLHLAEAVPELAVGTGPPEIEQPIAGDARCMAEAR
mmetsp:Transcript_1858/g.5612  ORF Transcript_1858/g.5612 Transcript_1858/m.5612 type:complete len:239 (+) Transcript_1858:335-1051(+)